MCVSIKFVISSQHFENLSLTHTHSNSNIPWKMENGFRSSDRGWNVAPGSKTLLQSPKTLPRRCSRWYKDMFSDSVKYWKSFQQSSQVSLLKDYSTKKTRSRCPRRSVSTRSIDLLQDNFCFDDWRKRMIIMTTFSFLITLRSLVLCDC